jgi:hypothetical protein
LIRRINIHENIQARALKALLMRPSLDPTERSTSFAGKAIQADTSYQLAKPNRSID